MKKINCTHAVLIFISIVVFLFSIGCANSGTSSIELGYDSSLETEVERSNEMAIDGNRADYKTVTLPFSNDGKGEFFWKLSATPDYINSWGMDKLTINDKDITNIWIAGGSLPAKQDGFYYVYCKASEDWSHVELKGTDNGSSSSTPSSSSSSSEPASSSSTSSTPSSSSEPSSSSSSSSSSLPNTSGKLRVMMSSDIGGTDSDDQQSMAHFLVYADMWDVVGMISSPWGNGRTSDILEAVAAYEKDYSNLKTYSADYPTPAYLRSVTKQGATSKAGSNGYGSSTEASEWIAKVAMNGDPRPLWITVWGGIEDVAQALHDHPEIESHLRVYWIAGPNRRNSPNASEYIAKNHKKLWIIEADETYRGFFNGGNMSGDLSNKEFPNQHIKGHGALGAYFMAHRTSIKMGDTPAVLYTLDNEMRNPGDPTKAGWGGAFIPYGSDRPNCWKDDPSKSSNGYDGAATVNIHREAFLRDFQARMDRCQSPK